MTTASRTFNDVYRQIFRVTDDMLAGHLDVHKSMAFAANMKVMNDIMNTEIKLRALERTMDNTLPALGRVTITTGEDSPIHEDADDREICGDSVRLISSTIPDIPIKKGPRKPRVGVVGLMPIQSGNVSSQFATGADFAFWNDGDDLKSLDAMANCDVVFLHTAHMGHSTTERLEAAGANIVNVGGGVTAMKGAIQKYFQALAEGMPK